MEIIKISSFLLFFILLQSLALLPLKKLQLHNSLLVVFSLGFLNITSGLTYYVNTLNILFITRSLVVAFCVTLLIEFITFNFIVRMISKGNNTNLLEFKNEKNTNREILILWLVVALLLLLFVSIYKLSYLFTLGDSADFVEVTRVLTIFEQGLFTLTYSLDLIDTPQIGLFYPWAGFILGAMVVDALSTTYINSTLVTLLFTASLAYFSQMYLLCKLLKIPNFNLVFLLLLTTNLFPIGLIFTGNYTMIYGLIAAITLLNLFLVLKIYLNHFYQFLFVIFSSIILFPLHPSSVVTLLVMIWVLHVLFLIPENYEPRKKIPKKVFLPLLAGSFILLVLFIFNTYSLRQTFFAFMASQPNYGTIDQFLSGNDLGYRILAYLWTNVFALSVWKFSLPVFFIIATINIYSLFKFNKKFSYLLPLFLYLFFILSSSVSGIEGAVSFISWITLPYYQTPARINHLGVVIYFFYMGLFLKDYQSARKTLKEI